MLLRRALLVALLGSAAGARLPRRRGRAPKRANGALAAARRRVRPVPDRPFDPDRQPFCVSVDDLGTPGTAPASTKRLKACSTGWAWAGLMEPEVDESSTARGSGGRAQKDLKALNECGDPRDKQKAEGTRRVRTTPSRRRAM